MVSKVGILFIGLACLTALVLLCAATSKLTGYGWPTKTENLGSFADDQKTYMGEVRARNLMFMAPPRRMRDESMNV